MSFGNKMDVLDMIINVLIEHEKTLDKLVQRLEKSLCDSKNIGSAPSKSRKNHDLLEYWR